MPVAQPLLDVAIEQHRAGNLDEAAELYARMLVDDPVQPDALNLLGLVRAARGDYEGALALYDRALDAHPLLAELHVNRAHVLRSLCRPDEAVAALRTATGLAPRNADAHLRLGNALRAAGHAADAVPALMIASTLGPDDSAVWLNLGAALVDTGAAAAAALAFERAVHLDPLRAECRNALGCALLSLGRTGEAVTALEAARALAPGDAAPLDNMARALRTAGLVEEALGCFREALALAPSAGTHSALLYTLNFSDRCSPEEVAAEHRRWADRWAEPLHDRQRPHADERDPARRLRVAYLSPDLNQHAVAHFIEPVLRAHDRAAIEVICYADGPLADATTRRLRALADAWIPVAVLDDEALAARVRADRIDLLVDLAGHTARHRLPVFARRPAPLQLTWIGYPHSTGLPMIDHRITEAVADPPGTTEHLHAEQLVRLPGVFSCYEPPADAPAVAPLPASLAGALTFGCFNNLSKMSPSTVGCWAALLAALPGSRLRLRARALEDPATAARVRRDFGAQGVDPGRLDLDPRRLTVPDHLACYAGVDVALDPFPYNGTTTTCEALWMGVPVLTVAGRAHAGRVGASLLTHLGLADWIARDPAELPTLGAALTRDLTKLASLRTSLRERMRASPLCDATGFTAHLEAAYRALWREYCAQG